MTSAELLTDAFGRIREVVDEVLDGVTREQLNERVGPDANPIGWLVWHLTRVQDDHVAAAGGLEQVWTSAGWDERFALDVEPGDVGYGQSSEQVAAVTVGADDLREYHHQVFEATIGFVSGLSDQDLDRVVDERWDPPVTLGVRLVSVIADDMQHAGQAAYVKGLLERRA